MQRLPIPPFSCKTALAKVQIAEDAWNSRDSFQGQAAIEYFLKDKWATQTHSQLLKELWACTGNRISVRFECEWQHVKTGKWYRSHGNEHWQFDSYGYMTYRDISANNVPISAHQRRIEHMKFKST